MFSYKRILLCCLSAILLCMPSLSLAEQVRTGIITVDLTTVSDEELQQAMDEIRAEQQRRVKTSILLDAEEMIVQKGKKATLKGKVQDLQNGIKAGKLQWVSSDESIATCKGGAVTGVSPSETVVVCSSVLSDGMEIKAECRVKVIIPVKAVTVKSKEITAMATEYIRPDIEIQPEDASIQTLAYESADDSIVHIEEDGRIKAVQAGETTVRATTTDGTKKECTFTVKVKRLVGVTDTEITFQGIEWGISQQEALDIMREKKLKIDDPGGYSSQKDSFFWPENDLDFLYNNLPDAFKESSGLDDYYGPVNVSFEPLMDIGPYKTKSLQMSFLPDYADGKLDNSKDHSHLAAITIKYLKLSDPNFNAKFFNLLSILEEKYGQFRLFFYNQPWVDYDAFTDAGQYLKKYAGDITMYTGNNMTVCMFAVCKGPNNTGIVLRCDYPTDSILLTYAKTDSYQDIYEIQKLLKTVPDAKEKTDL